jgi:hypothetical protein
VGPPREFNESKHDNRLLIVCKGLITLHSEECERSVLAADAASRM